MDEERDQQRDKGALADLIQVEARVEAQLTSAHSEAERIIESARRDADSLREDEDGALEAERNALRDTVERACHEKIRAIEDRAHGQEERFRSVDSAELQRLAGWVIERLLEGAEQP